MGLRGIAVILGVALFFSLPFSALSFAETLPEGVEENMEMEEEAELAGSETYKKGLLDQILVREKEAPEAETQQSERSTFEDKLKEDKAKQRIEDMSKEKEGAFEYKQRGLYY